MKNARHKSEHVLQELVAYAHRHGMNDLNIHLACSTQGFDIDLEGDVSCRPDDLDALKQALNAPRQLELEGYYYELLGSSRDGREFQLIGAMVEHAEVTCEQGCLRIHVRGR